MIRTVRGKRYLLVIIDRFSRWVEAVPSTDQGAQTVITFLTREVIPRFGIPSQISSDNGSAFIQRTVKTVIQQLRIKQRLGCVYHPQGLVERANGTLKAKLKKICADTKLNWVDALPLALMSYRMQTNRITNLTPHEMLTGRPMPVPYLRGPYEGPPLEQLQMELRAYMKQLTAIHEAINAQEQSRGPREEEETPGAIQPGDQVYLRVFRRRWNEPRREGPYTVVRATPTAVQVEGSRTWYHLNHCTRVPRLRPRRREEQPEIDEGDEQIEPPEREQSPEIHESEESNIDAPHFRETEQAEAGEHLKMKNWLQKQNRKIRERLILVLVLIYLMLRLPKVRGNPQGPLNQDHQLVPSPEINLMKSSHLIQPPSLIYSLNMTDQIPGIYANIHVRKRSARWTYDDEIDTLIYDMESYLQKEGLLDAAHHNDWLNEQSILQKKLECLAVCFALHPLLRNL